MINYIEKAKELLASHNESKVDLDAYPPFDFQKKEGFVLCEDVGFLGKLYIKGKDQEYPKKVFFVHQNNIHEDVEYDVHRYISNQLLGEVVYIKYDENNIIEACYTQNKTINFIESIENIISIRNELNKINYYRVLYKKEDGFVTMNAKYEKVFLNEPEIVQEINSAKEERPNDTIYLLLENHNETIQLIKVKAISEGLNSPELVNVKLEREKTVFDRNNIDLRSLEKKADENAILQILQYQDVRGIFTVSLKREDGEIVLAHGKRYSELVFKNQLLIGDIIEVSKIRTETGNIELQVENCYRSGKRVNPVELNNMINQGNNMKDKQEQKEKKKMFEEPEVSPFDKNAEVPLDKRGDKPAFKNKLRQ